LTGVRRAPSCAAYPVGDAAMPDRRDVVMKDSASKTENKAR